MDRSRIARNRRSMTPVTRGPERGQSNTGPQYQKEETTVENDRRYANHRDGYRRGFSTKASPGRNGKQGAATISSRKERSLSPFSKRLALTQAMNMGR